MPLHQKDPGLAWAGLFLAVQLFLPPSNLVTSSFRKGKRTSLEVLHKELEQRLPKAKHSPGTTVTTFPWGTFIMGYLSLGTSGRRCHGLNTRCSSKAPVNAGISRG